MSDIQDTPAPTKMSKVVLSNDEENQITTVVMSGPLSEYYTQALQIVFAKEPEVKANSTQATPSMESQLLDAIKQAALTKAADVLMDDDKEQPEPTTANMVGLNKVIRAAIVPIDAHPDSAYYALIDKLAASKTTELARNGVNDTIIVYDYSGVSSSNTLVKPNILYGSFEELHSGPRYNAANINGITIIHGFEAFVDHILGKSHR